MIVGESGNNCLENSFEKAFKQLNCEVHIFDIKKSTESFAKPSLIGANIHRFLRIEAWTRKSNKELVNFVKKFKPNLLLGFTNAEILPGTILYLQSIMPNLIISWYWPDPLPNLSAHVYNNLPLLDCLFSYSKSSLTSFKSLGCKTVAWIPFAGDIAAHYLASREKKEYLHDVSFVGSWRPERENALRIIHQNFPHFRIKVSGPYWNRCTYKPIKKIAAQKPLFGKDFTQVIQASFLSLNVMDDLNFPSANMRFFEIPIAGGAQLCSDSPEMKSIFIDKEHLLYFTNEEELVKAVEFSLQQKEKIQEMKIKCQQLIIDKHLYIHRAEEILKYSSASKC